MATRNQTSFSLKVMEEDDWGRGLGKRTTGQEDWERTGEEDDWTGGLGERTGEEDDWTGGLGEDWGRG